MYSQHEYKKHVNGVHKLIEANMCGMHECVRRPQLLQTLTIETIITVVYFTLSLWRT